MNDRHYAITPHQVGELEPERLGRAYVFLNKVRSIFFILAAL
jgi:hypothetical protein